MQRTAAHIGMTECGALPALQNDIGKNGKDTDKKDKYVSPT